jgi:hypothetical protein
MQLWIFLFVFVLFSLLVVFKAKLSKFSIIHPEKPLSVEIRGKLIGDVAGLFRIWKYDTHKSQAYYKFAEQQVEQNNPFHQLKTFRYKTKGFCKQEKKRTGRCGLCLGLDRLEAKLRAGDSLDENEQLDFDILERHKEEIPERRDFFLFLKRTLQPKWFHLLFTAY